jgi:hypothetical protein
MLIKLSQQATTAVSVDRVKQRLRIATTDDDADLAALILGASAAFEQATGLIIQPCSWEYRLDHWAEMRDRYFQRASHPFHYTLDRGPVFPFPRLHLPLAPIRDVTGITYLDADDAEQTIAPASYSWQRTPTGADIVFAKDFVFPQLSCQPQAVRVAFDAGFDDPLSSGSGEDPMLKLPPQALIAILYLVGHWYEFRESVVVDSRRAPFEIPQTFEYLVAQLKIFR